jgi:hypothetical protein
MTSGPNRSIFVGGVRAQTTIPSSTSVTQQRRMRSRMARCRDPQCGRFALTPLLRFHPILIGQLRFWISLSSRTPISVPGMRAA